MNTYLLIGVGIVTLMILVFVFRKNIKRVWFKLPFFEGGFETHSKQTTKNEEPVVVKKTKPETTLRKINEIETGKSVHNLPSNIYGFAHASWIDSELNGHGGALKLTNVQKSDWWFEIRKFPDDIYLLGYISQDAMAKIGNDRKNEITIFAKPWKEFKNQVRVPLSKISKCSTRTIDADSREIMILEIETEEVFII